MGVNPSGKVTTVVQAALFHQVAVGQQHGVLLCIGTQGDGVAGHHIRSVEKVRDAAKALGFTLREERITADVKARQLCVFKRIASGENFQVKSVVAFG